MNVNDDQNPSRLHTADSPPALLAIDNTILDDVMKRIVPNPGRLQKGDAMLGLICLRFLVIPLKDHRTYIQKCMYKNI